MHNEYSSAQNLPKITRDFSLNDVSNRNRHGKVELTKKDMQVFLQNGTISKEFIKQNKDELQKFIKIQARSGSLQHEVGEDRSRANNQKMTLLHHSSRNADMAYS